MRQGRRRFQARPRKTRRISLRRCAMKSDTTSVLSTQHMQLCHACCGRLAPALTKSAACRPRPGRCTPPAHSNRPLPLLCPCSRWPWAPLPRPSLAVRMATAVEATWWRSEAARCRAAYRTGGVWKARDALRADVAELLVRPRSACRAATALFVILQEDAPLRRDAAPARSSIAPQRPAL